MKDYYILIEEQDGTADFVVHESGTDKAVARIRATKAFLDAMPTFAFLKDDTHKKKKKENNGASGG